MSENKSWAREVEEYLLRLPPTSCAKWLDPFKAYLGQWETFQNKILVSIKGAWSDGLPWVWEMERLVPDRCVVNERTFDSIEGFMDYLQSRVSLYPYSSEDTILKLKEVPAQRIE